MNGATTTTLAVAIKFDPFEDVRRFFVGALARLGVTLPDVQDVHLVSVEYFHQLRRRIPARPRRVLWSKELKARSLATDEQQAVERIAGELERGEDVTPRLSQSIRSSVAETLKKGSYDGLLTDWGVHHLHIASTMRPDGFVVRGRALLFVFVSGDAAHLLDLGGHGTSSFASQDLFDIIHDNWPDEIASWQAPGAEPGSLWPKLREPRHRRQMREKFTTGVEARDGTVYLPPGGGVVLSGHSSEAVDQANGLLNLVRPAEVWMREHATWVRDQIAVRTGRELDELRLQFCVAPTLASSRPTVCETQTDIFLRPVPPYGEAAPTIGRRVRADATSSASLPGRLGARQHALRR